MCTYCMHHPIASGIILGIYHVYWYWDLATLYCYSRNTPCVLLLGHAVLRNTPCVLLLGHTVLLFKEYTMCIATGPRCIAIQGIHHVYCYWATLYCYSRIYVLAGVNSEWSFNPSRCKCIWTTHNWSIELLEHHPIIAGYRSRNGCTMLG